MRAGGYTVMEQALSPEASDIVRQAVSLARRRGHAQVTPLHVASAMLSSPASLLRSACLISHSHSHPLRCKALDLCFNVSLNRLPSSSTQLLIGPHRAHHQCPYLSNALVAAFKRAQAHQRRGSAADTQQQPMLSVKVDLEQLIISILDDPSVSRVMREAGFSSTQVKANLEKAICLDIMTSPPNPKPSRTIHGGSLRSEDVTTVLETLMARKKNSTVIVGECLASSEAVVRGLMDRLEKKEMPDNLRNLQFITLPLLSFEKMSKEELKKKVGEMRCLVRNCSIGRGVVWYLGDLKWAADYWVSCEESVGRFYCHVESAMKEIGELICGSGEFWLLGIATNQTYLRCRYGNPSLETLWNLQPLSLPAESLDLSLKHDRFEPESQSLTNATSNVHSSMISNLPPWLQQHKDDSRRTTTNDLDSLHLKDQCKKWNSIINSSHKPHQMFEKTLDSSVSLSSSGSYHTCQASSHNPNSSTSSETMEEEYLPKFKELNAENLKTLCNSLEKKVPWHKDVIPEIASTILQCRSGMMRRNERFRSAGTKEETWFFFLGSDTEGKEKIASELATMIFDSDKNFISIGLSHFSSNNLRSKRSRSGASHSYLERLVEVIQDNPHCVILLEDIDQVDYHSQMGIERAFWSGRFLKSTGEEVAVGDTIIILSCENFDSKSRACSPLAKQNLESYEEKDQECEEISFGGGLDLNLCAGGEEVEDWSFDDLMLLESVDRIFTFNLPDDS